MPLSLNYRFLLVINSILVLCSLALNVLLSHALWLPHEELPLWGQQSMATHLFAFSTVAGFALGWVATRATRWALRSSKVLPLHWHLKSQTLIDRLPSRTFNRAFMFALAGFSIAGIMVLLLSLLQLHLVAFTDFQQLSGIYSICFAGAITCMAVYRALADSIMSHSKV